MRYPHDLELTKEIENKIRLAQGLEKLKKLPEFKELLKNYLEVRPLELTYSLGGIDLDKGNEHNVTKQLTAIAQFKQYLDEIETDGIDAVADRKTYLMQSE